MPVVIDDIKVGGGSGGQRVSHLDQTFIIQQNVFSIKALVFDFIFLQGTHSQNKTSEDGPKLFFLKLSFLECPFVDFGAEVSLGVFPHGVNFINIGT